MLKRRKKKETYTAAVVSAWEVALFWAGICGGLPEGVPVGFSGGVPPCCPSGACLPGALPFMAGGVCPFVPSGGVMPFCPPWCSW